MNYDPLFVGLTRPTFIFGVSFQYAIMNLMVCGAAYVFKSSLKIVLLGFFLHFVGYVVCMKEPKFMEIFLTKSSKCSKCLNRSHYGANSYSV